MQIGYRLSIAYGYLDNFLFNLILIIMNSNVRKEEVSPLGDFILTSFTRDFEVIKSKFPRLNQAFMTSFVDKLDYVKHLESTLLLTENQKWVTASLYGDAKQLNKELNYLKAYFEDASLNKDIISNLKKSLALGNIEGSLLKLEGLKQFVVVKTAELVVHGMDPDYGEVLDGYLVRMSAKNMKQNELINQRKMLVEANAVHYDALFKMIKHVITKGKLVFRDTIIEDEYVIKKVVQRMRAAKMKNVE
jgi:hypothetical protein